jgi:hypothetical protein
VENVTFRIVNKTEFMAFLILSNLKDERTRMLEMPLGVDSRRFSIKVYIYIYAFPVEV